jgi:transcriptional regulator with XRE-family HTH domain
MSFGARLKEERRRLGLGQAQFAALVGTDMPKQSLYERGERQLRGSYLARLDPAGVDLLYVLTGLRSQGAAIGDDAAAFISAYLSLPDPMRKAVATFVGELTRNLEQRRNAGGSAGVSGPSEDDSGRPEKPRRVG